MSVSVWCAGSRPEKKRRLLASAWLLAAVVGLSATSPVQAKSFAYVPTAGAVLENSGSPAGAPSRMVGVWTSRPGETKDAFMRRVSVPLYAFTATTGVEACGWLSKERGGERFRVRVLTNGSQMGCALVGFEDPDFEPIGQTIHTHPASNIVTPNAQDVALFPSRGMGHTSRDRRQLEGGNFSDLDYSVGPGYVVTPGIQLFGKPHLLFQNGSPSTRKDLGRIPNLTNPSDLRPDEVASWVVRSPLPKEAPSLLSQGDGGQAAAVSSPSAPVSDEVQSPSVRSPKF